MLDQIVAHKQTELAELRRRRLPPPPPLRTVDLRRSPDGALRLIAEIKYRSPSAGPLSTALTPGARARAYERGGASMVSVLCDAKYFDGAYEHLAEARAGCSLPLLCKEFVLDECQLDAARAYGADAVLLIVRCLTGARLRELISAARERGLECLVEVYLPEEVPVALEAGATIIGVNARDLNTLRMDAERARQILEDLPRDVVAAHLSGLHDEARVRDVAASRADAALIGECLMRQDDPVPLLQGFALASRPAPRA